MGVSSLFLTLLVLGFIFGTLGEKMHFQSLKQREEKYKNIILSSTKTHEFVENSHHATLVTGHVVVALDYFKRFASIIVNITGGRVFSFESLIDRGRREAVIRMKEQAYRNGFNSIINVRIETSNIGSSAHKKGGMSSIEVMAYGTALNRS